MEKWIKGSNQCWSSSRVPKQDLINSILVLCDMDCCSLITFCSRMVHFTNRTGASMEETTRQKLSPKQNLKLEPQILWKSYLFEVEKGSQKQLRIWGFPSAPFLWHIYIPVNWNQKSNYQFNYLNLSSPLKPTDEIIQTNKSEIPNKNSLFTKPNPVKKQNKNTADRNSITQMTKTSRI